MIARLFGFLLIAGTLLGCASAEPEPAKVELIVTAAEDLNPGADGEPLPVIVRLYRMSASQRFERAGYDQIYNDDTKTMAGDLVGVVEFLFFPGQSETIERVFLPNERFLGVLVAFRDPASAKWRAITAIPPNRESRFVLHIDRRGATLRRA
jgi:type VI secretion system protein VasD